MAHKRIHPCGTELTLVEVIVNREGREQKQRHADADQDDAQYDIHAI